MDSWIFSVDWTIPKNVSRGFFCSLNSIFFKCALLFNMFWQEFMEFGSISAAIKRHPYSWEPIIGYIKLAPVPISKTIILEPILLGNNSEAT